MTRDPYDVGDIALLETTFEEPDPGDPEAFIPADPTTVRLQIWNPLGVLVVDTALPDPVIELEHPAVGAFAYRFVISLGGEWLYRWTATGPGAGSEDGSLYVTPGHGEAEAAWRPRLEDVALLCGAYTRQAVVGYERQAGRERDTFTDETSPTRGQVEAFIAEAAREVEGRAGTQLAANAPIRALARQAALWHAVASVEGKRRPKGTDDAAGAYRAAIANYRANLDELVSQARHLVLRLA